MGSVLVTGSSGFIGGRLVETLAGKGHRVYGLERRARAGSAGVIPGDLTDASLSVGDSTFECVFHLASMTPLERNSGKLRQVNLDGTKRLFETVREKVSSIIYVSGLGVFGAVDGMIDESTPYNPDTGFARMRLEAQRYLELECQKAGIKLSTVFFGDVYGPGGWFEEMMVKRLLAGSFRMPGGGRYRKAFLSVDDAAGSLAAVYETGLQRDAYVAADPEEVTFEEFAGYVADELGVKRPGSVPAFAAKMALGGDLVRLLCTPISVSNKLISEVYKFRYAGFREGVESAISAMHRDGRLPPKDKSHP